MSGAVRDNAKARRFELDLEGEPAVSYYRLEPGVITFTHTEVPAALRERGIASRLMAGALDEVRRWGLEVVPQCPFVATFIARHKEYRELLKDGGM